MSDFDLACRGWQTVPCQEYDTVLQRSEAFARLCGCAFLAMPLHNVMWYHPEVITSSEAMQAALAWLAAMEEWAAHAQPIGWTGPKIGPRPRGWLDGGIRDIPPKPRLDLAQWYA